MNAKLIGLGESYKAVHAGVVDPALVPPLIFPDRVGVWVVVRLWVRSLKLVALIYRR